MYHEYFGNIHMHTTHSDGTGTVDDIVAAAQTAGLDYTSFVLCGHGTFKFQDFKKHHPRCVDIVEPTETGEY